MMSPHVEGLAATFDPRLACEALPFEGRPFKDLALAFEDH